MMPNGHKIATTVLLLLLPAAARGGDWLQWRGPNLNGSTDETDLPVSFSRTENIAWVVRMPGLSGATPIVVGERIFLSSSVYDSSDLLGLCLSAGDGREIWRKTFGRGTTEPRGEMAASSPCSDGKRVYFVHGNGMLSALTFDGAIVWQRDMTKEYGPMAVKFGYGCTPLLHEGKMYVVVLRRERPYSYNPGAETAPDKPLESFVMSLDPATGKTLWRQVRKTDATEESREVYITPMPIKVGERTEIVIPGGEFVTGHDAATGKELWRWEITPTRLIWQRIVASPTIGAGLIFFPQAKARGFYALRPGGRGRLGAAAYAWKRDDVGSDVCTPLLYRGLLYVVNGDRKTITALRPKTGKTVWQQKLTVAGPFRASPTGADGKVHLISEGGDVVILAAGEQYKELFRISLGARPSRSSIVPAHKSLYLRLSKHLVCVRNLAATP